jgi:RsiW-degrading membrane proteinase PrsW (M82 family)
MLNRISIIFQQFNTIILMPKLRLKIIKSRPQKHPTRANNFFIKCRQYIHQKLNKLIDSDILPLIIAPSIFILLTALEWWYWYLEIPTPSPILLTIIAFFIGAFCAYKLFWQKKNTNDPHQLHPTIERHTRLH